MLKFLYLTFLKKLRDVVNTQKSAGTHIANFNANNLESGIYIYRIEARALSGEENFIAVKKMVLIK